MGKLCEPDVRLHTLLMATAGLLPMWGTNQHASTSKLALVWLSSNVISKSTKLAVRSDDCLPVSEPRLGCPSSASSRFSNGYKPPIAVATAVVHLL